MPKRTTCELTAKEKSAIRKLVTSSCANYDHEYECLLLDGTCYMFTIAYNTSNLCKYFKNAVLPLNPDLERVFIGGIKPTTKPCGICGKMFDANGRQTYCSPVCVQTAKKAATAKRVRKHRNQ